MPNVLLWSPYGSGEHYSGPAKYTYRVYSEMPPGKFNFSLAHGFAQQENLPIFQNTHMISNLVGDVRSTLRFVREGKNWVKENASRFDLFHAVSGYQTTVPAAHLAKKAGVPVVLFVSNERGGLASKGGLKQLLGVYSRRQKMAREFDAIIALSKEIAEELRTLGTREDRIVSIPNFADTTKYCLAAETEKTKLRQELNLRNVPTVVFVGRVTERKRPHLIGEAIGQLKRQNIEAQAVFVGPFDEQDPYYTRIVSHSRENGYGERLIFTNFTNAVPQWLKASDVFCLPSANEGMPGALVEAMGCGLPAVVSPFSSARELVKSDEFGRVLSGQGSSGEIAETLREYFSQPISRPEQIARSSFVEDNYSLAAIATKYSNLFQRLIAG